ncbi:hypothetical protein PIB30_054841 [Stylosanthes scabra]|uniref:RNase H type-1 domain-containing protein n=1 Tax=Stylosanthes scabra TaxID=79078 RepID=A0ABU6RJT6_9FABA|nr:hypothetical protein [Stylosanthes scabra]
MGQVKCNTDGAYCNARSGATAAVFRNAEGKIIIVNTSKALANSAIAVEAMALRNALKTGRRPIWTTKDYRRNLHIPKLEEGEEQSSRTQAPSTPHHLLHLQGGDGNHPPHLNAGNKGEDELAEQEAAHSAVHHHHPTQVFYPPLLRPPAPLKNADGRFGGATLWMAYQGSTIAGLVKERERVCRLA